MGVSGALGSADPADPFDIESAAVVIIDAGRLIVHWSPGAGSLLGYPAGDVVGRPVECVVEGGDLAAAASRLRRTGQGWTGVLGVRHRAGRVVDLAIRACPLLGADGHHGWLVVARDAKEQAEHEFFEAVAQGLLERSPIGIAMLDTDLRWKWSNRALADMEEPRPDQDEASWTLTDAGESAPVVNRHARRALITGQPQVTLEHSPPHHDMSRRTSRTGERCFRLRSFFPVRNAAGETLGICLVALHATGQDSARDRLTLLNEASEHIGTTLDLDRTVQELAEVVVPRVADFVAIDLLDAVRAEADPPRGPTRDERTLRRAAHLSIQEDRPEVVVEIGAATHYPARSPQERCLATGKPIREVVSASTPWLVNDSQRWMKLVRLGVHTHLVVPLRARGITMGVVTLLRWKNPEPFDEDDLLLVEELVARAAVCVDNARRFARQHQAALTLQTSLLPPDLPQHNAVEVAYRYLPADTEAGVGGDWFDVIPLSGARVALIVGDVVGHGLHAAASMGRLRAAVQTLADLDLPPDELLTHVDDLVVRLSDEAEASAEGPVVVGATCVYAVYDPVARTIVVARAGHPSPAIAHLREPVEFPDIPAGPPLGLGGLPFESAEIAVEEGSIIALYTDGLIEASDRDVDVGMERLCFTLAHPDRPLEELCDIMVRTLLPERPRDDVAFLIARTHALSPDRVFSWDIPADPSAVHVARNNAVRQLSVWGLDEVAFTTELIVSELVTNAIRHAYGPIRLRLIHERALICEVSDASNTSPHLRRALSTDEGGRGLFLVAQVAQRWGTRHTSGGKTIWAEQQLPDGA
ncbi:SpoIIE family protein phosphatase [Streptomyces sp. NPDC051636]|uniref:SpoIIE family protein phosphatase n=1 Tax=Streptomyces sp. NPDC051636 TaxID=3365663 RepID=UPI0037B30247